MAEFFGSATRERERGAHHALQPGSPKVETPSQPNFFAEIDNVNN
jgi:hypothetical protein